MNDWVNAEQHAERARTFYQNGEWEKALAELRQAIAINPDQAEWHFGMGLTLDALDRFDEALEAYEHALLLRGDDPEVMMHVGIDLIRLGRNSEAIDTLARCNKLDPSFEPGYCHRIAAYARLGQHEQAEQMFYLARQVRDECPNCCDHLAHSLRERGQIDKSIWCWQQTLRLAPDHEDVRADLGMAHWERGQLERANVLFEQQLSHNPDDLDTRLHLGRLQLEMDRAAEALKTFRSALDVEPLIPEAHFYLGEIAVRAGHLDDAALEYAETVRIDPGYVGAHLRLAQVEARRGRLREAQVLLNVEADKPDHSPDEAIEISRMMIDLGMMTQAIALLSRVVTEVDLASSQGGADDNDAAEFTDTDADTLATVLLHRGYAFLVTGRRDAGIADCRRALRLTPGSPLAMHNLALAYLEAGSLRRATYFHRRAAAMRPSDPMIRRLGHRIRRAKFANWLRRFWRR